MAWQDPQRGSVIMRNLGILVFLSALTSSVNAQDALPADKLALIKRATVLITVENGEAAGSGSGFLIKNDATTGYIVTNNHVIDFQHRTRRRDSSRTESIEVVFDSGQPHERVVKGEVVAADPERDLAILKVSHVKSLPEPIPLEAPGKLIETMPVLVCGFPFGNSLRTSRKHAAITISNSTISSVRLNDAGQVAEVQLSASAMNPGNSGGPVLTMDGKLVGVGAAGIRGAGIGFAIPYHEVHRMIAGRIGLPSVFAQPADSATLQLTIEAPLIDAFGHIRGVMVHCKAASTGERPPQPDSSGVWPALTSTPLEASIKADWAQASLRLPRAVNASGVLWIQFEQRTEKGVVRHAPIALDCPAFPTATAKGRYLTANRSDRREARPSSPKGELALKDLNRSPDKHLGQSVTFDAVFIRVLETANGRATVALGFDRQARPANVTFIVPSSLSDQLHEAAKGEPVPVRVIGTVLAPRSPNAPYPIELEEISTLGSDGAVIASYRPSANPIEKPIPSTPAVSPPTPPISEPKAESPTHTPEKGSIASNTIVAAVLALVVGGSVVGYFLIARRKNTKAPDVPVRTVAERLNRRIR